MINNFQELKNLLDDGEITRELMNCVDFTTNDGSSQLILSTELAGVPDGFDIDEEIYRLHRRANEHQIETQEAGKSNRKRVVAEGDSWFNLPPFIRPQAIADRMKSNGKYKVSNIARWGHTLKDVLSDKEYLEEIERYRADCLLLSVGGNDLQDSLKKNPEKLIHHYDPNRSLDNYLTDYGIQFIEDEIREDYENLLSEVNSSYPGLPVFCHAYDYPRPLNTGGKGDHSYGKYIGQYLDKLGIPPNEMKLIMIPIMNKLNSVVESVVKSRSAAHFINCRNHTDEYKWRDDMHPKKRGFIALADIFESELDRLLV